MSRGVFVVLALAAGCMGGGGDGFSGDAGGDAAGGDSQDDGHTPDAATRADAAAPSGRSDAGRSDAATSQPDGNFFNPGRLDAAAPPRRDAGSALELDAAESDCASLRLASDIATTIAPGNVLVLFDVSASMQESWSSTSKLVAAVDAVVQAVTPLQDQLTVGAIFFPTTACIALSPPPPGGAVEPIDGPAQLDFQPGADFLKAWDAKFGGTLPSPPIGTPLTEAMQRADDAIAGASLTGQLLVLLFTDGAPNCFPGDGSGSDGSELSLASAWAQAGIPTYVVGLPGASGVQLLNQIASAGGTGTYLLPDDPSALQSLLSGIVSDTVSESFDSCTIQLSPAAEATDLLHVVVSQGGSVFEAPRDLGGGAGWSVSGDGAQVQLLGAFCDAARGGAYERIEFEFGCVDLPPLPAL